MGGAAGSETGAGGASRVCGVCDRAAAGSPAARRVVHGRAARGAQPDAAADQFTRASRCWGLRSPASLPRAGERVRGSVAECAAADAPITCQGPARVGVRAVGGARGRCSGRGGACSPSRLLPRRAGVRGGRRCGGRCPAGTRQRCARRGQTSVAEAGEPVAPVLSGEVGRARPRRARCQPIANRAARGRAHSQSKTARRRSWLSRYHWRVVSARFIAPPAQ